MLVYNKIDFFLGFGFPFLLILASIFRILRYEKQAKLPIQLLANKLQTNFTRKDVFVDFCGNDSGYGFHVHLKVRDLIPLGNPPLKTMGETFIKVNDLLLPFVCCIVEKEGSIMARTSNLVEFSLGDASFDCKYLILSTMVSYDEIRNGKFITNPNCFCPHLVREKFLSIWRGNPLFRQLLGETFVILGKCMLDDIHLIGAGATRMNFGLDGVRIASARRLNFTDKNFPGNVSSTIKALIRIAQSISLAGKMPRTFF